MLQFQPQCRAQFSETKVQTSCWPLSTPAHKVAGSEPDAVSPGELPVSGIGTVQSPLALHHVCDATSCVVGLSVDKTSCRAFGQTVGLLRPCTGHGKLNANAINEAVVVPLAVIRNRKLRSASSSSTFLK